jgi:hypothetical protein
MKRFFRIQALILALVLFSLQTSTAQDTTTGRGVLEASLEATGGIEAWRTASDLISEADIEFAIPQLGSLFIKLESWSIFPGFGYTNIEMIDGPAAVPAEQVNQKAYYTPLEGWVEGAQGRMDINEVPPAQRSQIQRSNAKAELTFLNLPDSALVLLEDEIFNEKPVYAINVTNEGVTSKFLFDKESLYNVAQESATPVGNVVSIMSDFRDVNGFIFAFSQTADMGAQGKQTITFSKVEINTGLTPEAVAKKAGVTKKVASPE